MSNYSNLIKNGGCEFDRHDYDVDHAEVEALAKKIAKKEEELLELQTKFAEAKEKALSNKYTPSPSLKAVYYLRTGEFYDWDTGLPIENVEGRQVIELRQVDSQVEVFLGYDAVKGILIFGNYRIKVNSAKGTIRKIFRGHRIANFCNDDGRHYGSTGFDMQDTKMFMKDFFDIDYSGEKDLLCLSLCFQQNKSFEIILRELSGEIADKLLEMEIKTAMPVHKILNVSKPIFKLLKDEELIKERLEIMDGDQSLFKSEIEMVDYLRRLKEAKDDFRFYGISDWNPVGALMMTRYQRNKLNKHYSFKHFVDYVIEGTINQGYRRVDDFIIDLSDYIEMCNTIGQKPLLYSDYLKQTHDVTARNYDIAVDKMQEEILGRRYAEFKDEQIDDYHVIVPKCSDDIKAEGSALNHCVASYIKKVIDGHCLIFFLRKNKDVSLITFEVRDDAVVQIRGSHNRAPKPEEKQAIIKWAKNHGYKVR